MNLNQVTVPSIDLEKSIPFYETLGLKLIVKALPHYARFEATNGATFSLSQQDKLSAADGVTVYFEMEDLDNYVNALLEKGIPFDELPNDKPYLWREARLKDLDGNKLILYYAGENRLNPPWKVK